MATLDRAIDQMRIAGMPEMPKGHPQVDGKWHRYARKGRAWYVLQPFTDASGRVFVQGKFGVVGKLEAADVYVVLDDFAEDAKLELLGKMELAQHELELQATLVLATISIEGWDEQKQKGDESPKPATGLERRFTLIYPTDTAYDHDLGDIVAISAMRLKFGNPAVQGWLAGGSRRDVDLPDVVFDPTEAAKPPKLNLFRGLAVKPSKEGSCAKLIELLAYLCGDDTNVFEWVLNWLAYPLKHVGAKMQTAIVIAGRQRTGKNLFFRAMREIYGKHAVMITQAELEDRFNLWLSAKLFVIANEVVTRQEMSHKAGYLKHLITEEEIWINRKMKDARVEANHCNLVFFSNESQPVRLDADDGRYVIIRTPPKREKAFYSAVAAEISNGGAAALLAYLLEFDGGKFDEYAEPIETQAKRDLVEISMNSPQLLWRDIHDQEIPIPYCPALVEHLYQVYLFWCRRFGEKMPARINRFIPDFMALNGVRRVQTRVPELRLIEHTWDALPSKRRQRRILLMGEGPPPGDADATQKWIDDGVLEFAQAMEDYCFRERTSVY